MSKRWTAAIIAMTVMLNGFTFFHICNGLNDELFWNKACVAFRFYQSEQLQTKEEFLNKVESFSGDSHVEIAQYFYLNSERVDVYSTMADRYHDWITLPGIMSKKEIVVHDFHGLADVGLKNCLYVDTDDPDVIKDLSEILKDECELYDVKAPDHSRRYVWLQVLRNNSRTLIPMIILYLLLNSVLFFLYGLGNQNRCCVYRLWGYTDFRICCMLSGPWHLAFLMTTAGSHLVLMGMTSKSMSAGWRWDCILASLVLYLVIMVGQILLSLTVFGSFCMVWNHDNRKQFPSRLVYLSWIARLLLLCFFLVSVEQWGILNRELMEKREGLSVWEQSRALFHLYESYSPLYINDLAAEDVLNKRMHKVYQELGKTGKLFMMETKNYEHLRTGYPVENVLRNHTYAYSGYVERMEDLYSPAGKSIVVDGYFLERHMIRTDDGKNALDMLDRNACVLNILVPVEYQCYESIIEQNYRNWFYFQSVEVPNIYRRARGDRELEISRELLQLNIIYIENNQKLFTYDPKSGDDQNMIHDAIITVYTDNLDESFLASCFGDYIFIEAADEYHAMEEIRPVTEKYNAIELNTIASVYDKKGEEIRAVEEEIINHLVYMVAEISLLLLGITGIIYCYNQCCYPVIMVRSLYGYSFLRIYLRLIIFNALAYAAALLPVLLRYRSVSCLTIWIVLLIAIGDFGLSYLISRRLRRTGESRLQKGYW